MFPSVLSLGENLKVNVVYIILFWDKHFLTNLSQIHLTS